jgi:hypothetical protein
MDCLCILTGSIVMVNNIYVSVFFVVGDMALYGGRQHNCQDPKPKEKTHWWWAKEDQGPGCITQVLLQ